MPPDFAHEREQMVRHQIEKRGITNSGVLNAMRTVPRHLFVPLEMREQAYADYPLPIGSDQTISQPYIVAFMTALLNLTGSEKVLEIGTGSGYQAAVLSLLAREVITVEYLPALARSAGDVLRDLGYLNVTVHQGDGSLGWADQAPYDAIMVTASAPKAPEPLLKQLNPEGRMVLPVGGRGVQWLELWLQENGIWLPEVSLPVAFVPLRGAFGWQDDHE